MKFCPNCGSLLEGKKLCECGYNIETNEVDEKMNQIFNKKNQDNYERQCDNIRLGMGMGTYTNDSTQKQQPIFNKEPDMILGSELLEQLKEFHRDVKEVEKEMNEFDLKDSV